MISWEHQLELDEHHSSHLKTISISVMKTVCQIVFQSCKISSVVISSANDCQNKTVTLISSKNFAEKNESHFEFCCDKKIESSHKYLSIMYSI